MARLLLILSYIILLLIPQVIAPVLLDFINDTSNLNYLGQSLGIFALTMFTLQILMSSRLFGLDKKVGLPFYLGMHGILAILLIFVVLFHRFIKFYVDGYSESTQNILGSIVFFGLIAVSLITLLFMHPGLLGKLSFIKKFRSQISTKLKLTYARFRFFHIILLCFYIVIVIHILLATDSTYRDYIYYEAGLALISIVLYIRYRLRKRKA